MYIYTYVCMFMYIYTRTHIYNLLIVATPYTAERSSYSSLLQNVGLFCRNVGLFFRNVGLFGTKYRALLQKCKTVSQKCKALSNLQKKPDLEGSLLIVATPYTAQLENVWYSSLLRTLWVLLQKCRALLQEQPDPLPSRIWLVSFAVMVGSIAEV